MSVQRSSPEDFFTSLQVSYSVSSTPVIGVPFKVNGSQQVTPYNGETLETTISLEAYPSVAVGGQIYAFKNWDDGVTSLTRVGDLTVKRSYMMVYQLIQQAQSVTELDYRPVIILVAVVFGFATICFLAYLSKR